MMDGHTHTQTDVIELYIRLLASSCETHGIVFEIEHNYWYLHYIMSRALDIYSLGIINFGKGHGVCKA